MQQLLEQCGDLQVDNLKGFQLGIWNGIRRLVDCD